MSGWVGEGGAGEISRWDYESLIVRYKRIIVKGVRAQRRREMERGLGFRVAFEVYAVCAHSRTLIRMYTTLGAIYTFVGLG